LIFAVLTLFRGPDGEFHAKFVFLTNFEHIDMNNVSYIAICPYHTTAKKTYTTLVFSSWGTFPSFPSAAGL
jgi:hypothetical protein